MNQERFESLSKEIQIMILEENYDYLKDPDNILNWYPQKRTEFSNKVMETRLKSIKDLILRQMKEKLQMFSEEDYKTETIGYELGNNPRFGKWEQKFDFPPVSYSNKSELKQEFKRKLQSEISVKYIFTQQIQLRIILYLNEEKMLTTPEYGDLDNYAKSIS